MDSPRELAAMIRTEIEEGKEWQSLSSPVWLTFELADAIATALERADRLERALEGVRAFMGPIEAEMAKGRRFPMGNDDDGIIYEFHRNGYVVALTWGDLRAALATGKGDGK